MVHLNTWILGLACLFAWVKVKGGEHLDSIEGPVLFVANHQGYFDVPVLLLALPGKWRRRLAPAMRKEFFDAHFYPGNFSWREVLTNRLNYFLACHVFNAVPIPQRDVGTRDTLRFLGELASRGECPLIFPEGRHSRDESVGSFQPGAAMIATRLGLPVVPVRIRGSNRVLHPSWRFPRPGRVEVTFGRPIMVEGDDFRAITRQLEEAVRGL